MGEFGPMNAQDPLFRFRRTGRTYRMCQEAVSLAKQGKTLHLVAATATNVEYVRHMLLELLTNSLNVTSARDDVKIGKGRICLLSSLDPSFNLRTQRINGHSPTETVLIDHYVFEYHFPRIIYEWAKWL